MTKVLVLSYFFPPCSLTASNRVSGIVSSMHRFGLYPVVITRHWDKQTYSPDELLRSTTTEIIHTKYEGYEVYYLPYRSSLRDRILIHSNKIKVFKILSKVLTLMYLVLEPFSNLFVPFSNLYSFSKEYLVKNKDVKMIMVSANPFILFKFGYLLSKRFKIPWVADYRDAWTTNKMAIGVRGFNIYLYKLYRFFEKKWVNSSAFYLSVSDEYVNKIGEILSIQGFTIYNGFLEPKHMSEFSDENEFNILYSGTLYYNQPIEEFIIFLIRNNFIINDMKINLIFAGLNFDKKQTQRVKEKTKGFENHIQVLDWLSKDEYKILQTKTDLFLMLPYLGFKGIPSSKLFDYLSTQKNILLYKTDNDLIEKILIDSKVGFVGQDDELTYDYIKKLVQHKKLKSHFLNPNILDINSYSMEKQVKNLSTYILKNI
jgi:glycosyltransferase involved in cell wall biosynthesis